MARHEVTDRPGAELVVEVVLEQDVSLGDDALLWRAAVRQGSETAERQGSEGSERAVRVR